MPLDVKKLKESGYTESELVDILGKKMGANVARAREANVSEAEILTALAARATGDEVKPKRGIVGEFVAGMKQGAYQLPQMVGGVTKLVGDAVGSETVSDLGRDAIGYWGEKAAEHAPTVGSFTDIEDAGDAARKEIDLSLKDMNDTKKAAEKAYRAQKEDEQIGMPVDYSEYDQLRAEYNEKRRNYNAVLQDYTNRYGEVYAPGAVRASQGMAPPQQKPNVDALLFDNPPKKTKNNGNRPPLDSFYR